MIGCRSDDLITRIQRDILDEITETSTPLNSTDVLDIASDILADTCAPFLTETLGEFYVTYEDISTSSNQASYNIPAAASFSALRDLTLLRSDGSTKNLIEVSYSDLQSGSRSTQIGEPSCYYLQNNQVILSPAPDSAYTLRLSYHRRPERLVLSSYAATIQSGSGGTYDILDGSDIPLGGEFGINIQRAQPHFDVFHYHVGIDSLTNDELMLLSAPSAALEPVRLDYVTDAGEVVIPELPVELHPWLARLTASEVLEARGDSEGASRLMFRAEQQLAKFMKRLERRNKGETQVIVKQYGLFGHNRLWW